MEDESGYYIQMNQEAINVRGLDHIVVNPEDPATVLEFYQRTLGVVILRLDGLRHGKVSYASVGP